MSYGPLRAYVALLGVGAIVFGTVRFSEALLLVGLGLIAVAAWDGRKGVRVPRNVGSVLLAVAATAIAYGICLTCCIASLWLIGVVGVPLGAVGLLLRWIGRPEEDPEKPPIPRWL